jgi:hypothetical protein
MRTDMRERRRIGGGHNIPTLLNLDPAAYARYFTPVVAGTDLYGTLGEVTPSQPAMPQEATEFAATGNAIPTQISPHDFYTFHLGDLFFPGGPAWVLDQKFETPLMCIWGNGLLLAPNRGFQAYQPIPPIYYPTLPRVATPWGAQANYPWYDGVLPGVSGTGAEPQFSPEAQASADWNPAPNVDFAPTMSDY